MPLATRRGRGHPSSAERRRVLTSPFYPVASPGANVVGGVMAEDQMMAGGFPAI